MQLAVETLLKVHDSKPQDPLAKRVSSRLFEALTELMQLDFPKASKDYLTIYESLVHRPRQPQRGTAAHGQVLPPGRPGT